MQQCITQEHEREEADARSTYSGTSQARISSPPSCNWIWSMLLSKKRFLARLGMGSEHGFLCASHAHAGCSPVTGLSRALPPYAGEKGNSFMMAGLVPCIPHVVLRFGTRRQYRRWEISQLSN